MPYRTVNDLPESVRDHLPTHGQEIYRAAYNSAWDEYKDPDERRGKESREEAAHKVAWAAVKHQYEKDERTGDWRAKNSAHSGT
ncbi:MAG TPA: ChaB family protein [Ktedonobacterales bacterium]|nr:ChaB family protein [Ktedonobacterales bacterium]